MNTMVPPAYFHEGNRADASPDRIPSVVVERLPPGDYARHCVRLAPEYGGRAWDRDGEVVAIRAAVMTALDTLDSDGRLSRRLAGRKIVVKPNLVLVYSGLGTVRSEYPETTDPRVLDALVLWLKERSKDIVLAESSGRGSPTRVSFAVSGLDRLARKRGCSLVVLEEEPPVRFFVPKAKVQKEILVPRLFASVVRGESAYVSVPKLKTNLFTGVSLGLKNTMGILPYNLRQRDHTRSIGWKLADSLHLLRPDLVLVDGVVGGEGECPAPVDPVDSRMIVAGDDVVETDRIATALMGFDPASVGLTRYADASGFGSGGRACVRGDTTPVHFRPADDSLLSPRVRRLFPNLRILYGIGGGPETGKDRARTGVAGTPDAREVEARCSGGCVASIRFGLAMLEAEGLCENGGMDRPATILVGGGITAGSGTGETAAAGSGAVMERGEGGEKVWIDAEGRTFDRDAIADIPGPKAVIGGCGSCLSDVVDLYAEGCMPLPNAPHALLHRLTGTRCGILSTRNRRLGLLLPALLATRSARRALLRRGVRLDVDYPSCDRRETFPAVVPGDQGRDWIEWPLPPLEDRAELARLLAFEDESVIASLRGEFDSRPGRMSAPGLVLRLLGILFRPVR